MCCPRAGAVIRTTDCLRSKKSTAVGERLTQSTLVTFRQAAVKHWCSFSAPGDEESKAWKPCLTRLHPDPCATQPMVPELGYMDVALRDSFSYRSVPREVGVNSGWASTCTGRDTSPVVSETWARRGRKPDMLKPTQDCGENGYCPYLKPSVLLLVERS